MLKVAVFGITGRMGQALLRALRETPAATQLSLCGAVASVQSARLSEDAAAAGEPTGIVVTADAAAALDGAAVALDFSLPEGVAGHAAACVHAGVPLLVGTTGFDAGTRADLEAAGRRIPVLIAPNTSTAVSVMAALVSQAAHALGPGYEVEIYEAHHRSKRDAPSGTALALGDVIARARGERLAETDFAVLRAGDIVGEHTVSFSGYGERLEITHRALDRMAFARGALRAAQWLAGQPAGLYGMQHVGQPRTAQTSMDSDPRHR
jgi:4-hydroxy-tetrahydrodipicolinate reductase